MTKLATLLAALLVFSGTLAMAQKGSVPARSSGTNSGSSCGPMTTKANGKPQTIAAHCGAGSQNASNLPTQGSMAGRLLNQKLGKATPRSGTPDFLPSSTTVSGNQVP